MSNTSVSSPSLPDLPYPGIEPYRFIDKLLFAAREKEAAELGAKLTLYRAVLLYGEPGTGKTSLINAGLLPRTAGVYNADRLRIQPFPNRELRVERILWRGGRHPAYFPSSFTPMTELASDTGTEYPSFELSLVAFHEQLYQQYRRTIPKSSESERYRTLPKFEGPRPLLIFDQFEELITLFEESQRADQSDPRPSSRAELRKLQAPILEMLVQLIRDPTLPVKIVFVFREDFLAKLDILFDDCPELVDQALRLVPPPVSALTAIIRKPFENEELRAHFQTAETISVMERLASSIADDLTERSLDDRINLSELQIVCWSLWRSDDPEKLYKEKGVSGLVAQYGDAVVKHFPSEWQPKVRALLPEMLTDSNTRNIVSRDTLNGVASREGMTRDQLQEVLDVLCENQILRRERHRDLYFYEIASEYLVSWISKLAYLSEVEHLKKKARKVRNRYLLSLLIVIVVAIIIAVFAGRSLRDRQRRLASEETARVLKEEKAKTQRWVDAVKAQDNRVPYSKAVLRGHGAKVTSAIFTSNNTVLTASLDKSVILWDIASQSPITELDSEHKLVMAAAGQQPNVVITASTDGTVTLWYVALKGHNELRGQVGHHITDISFSPGANLVAAANTEGEIIIWNSNTGERIKQIPGNGKAIHQLLFSPYGSYLAAASEDNNVHVWRVNYWDDTRVFSGHTDIVNGIAFSPDTAHIASASADTTLRVWDLTTGVSRVYKDKTGHVLGINSVSYNRDGTRLLTASDDTTARIWDVKTGASVSLIGHTDKVFSASFSPDGSQVVTGSKDATARVWSLSGKSLVELRGHLDEITYVSFSPDGKLVLTASDDATARVWVAPESGKFDIDQPTITANPNFHPGECPVTISFQAIITAVSGSGTVSYRFRGSDGRIWPPRELNFDEPGSKYVNWYWRISNDFTGYETIEILEPKGIKSQSAKFKVKCVRTESPTPEPSPTASP